MDYGTGAFYNYLWRVAELTPKKSAMTRPRTFWSVLIGFVSELCHPNRISLAEPLIAQFPARHGKVSLIYLSSDTPTGSKPAVYYLPSVNLRRLALLTPLPDHDKPP